MEGVWQWGLPSVACCLLVVVASHALLTLCRPPCAPSCSSPDCLSGPLVLQVVGFLVLLSGTSVYNEILRTCLPAPEPRRRSSRRHGRSGVPAMGGDAGEEGLQEPLLLGEADFTDAHAAAQQQEQQRMKRPGGVRFAEAPPPSRPIAAGRQQGGEHGRYTMARQGLGQGSRGLVLPEACLALSACVFYLWRGGMPPNRLLPLLPCAPYRSVTILPAAMSPHSLASVPSASFGDASFTFRCGTGREVLAGRVLRGRRSASQPAEQPCAWMRVQPRHHYPTALPTQLQRSTQPVSGQRSDRECVRDRLGGGDGGLCTL